MRGYVDTSIGQMHYAHEGTTGPQVVLIHCYNTNLRLYERALPLLGERVQAWAFDAPATGMSDSPDVPKKTVIDVAGWFIEAMDNLGIERPIIGGLHTGARMSLEIARVKGADQIPALILSGPGPLTPVVGGLLKAENLEEMKTDAEGTQWDRALARYRQIFPSQEVATEDNGWLQHIYLWCSMEHFAKGQFKWQGEHPEGYEQTSFYEAFPNPILWLNTPEDCFSSTDLTQAPMNPNSELRMLQGLGSHIMLRDPEVYTEEIFAFLERVGILN